MNETENGEEVVDSAESPLLGDNRQPIVSVLGHVDHGKTSILDYFRSLGVERQASVMAREAGGITQHIGATEVPAELLNEACEEMMGGRKFKSPGLLFIDTPGHHSFTSLRNRGGALADIAILVVDLMEGLQPQTIESLNILRKQKTPFVVAANKIDRLHLLTNDPMFKTILKKNGGSCSGSFPNMNSISNAMINFVISLNQ
jgi:translation initiation factor 5B